MLVETLGLVKQPCYSPPAMSSLERRVAVDAARAAGQLLRAAQRGPRQIAYKGTPTNLVTEMDARAEALILGRLAQAFPADAVLAEESGRRAGSSGRRWIVDPLDGTTNYAHGVPIYAVSLALERAGDVVLGVIFDPNHDELFVCERGAGASLNGHALAVSRAPVLDESLLATGFPYGIRETSDTNLPEHAAFSLRARGVRRLGSAVLYLAYVAAGRLDGYWEQRLGPWDVAAGALLVEEAGGKVTSLEGGRLDLEAPAVVASNGLIHEAMLGVLRETRAGGPRRGPPAATSPREGRRRGEAPARSGPPRKEPGPGRPATPRGLPRARPGPRTSARARRSRGS
jgi:myo-inositol-1(or 4)-monophosphatase